MKIVYCRKNNYFLRFDPGEEVMRGLTNFAKSHKIGSAKFSAIGAASELKLSFYDLVKRRYADKHFQKDFEIASLIGNIAWLGHEPVVHAHGSFSDKTFKTLGGHVKMLKISATCEVTLVAYSDKTKRIYNNKTGLNLLT